MRRRTRLLGGLAAAVVGIPMGFAVAQEQDSGSADDGFGGPGFDPYSVPAEVLGPETGSQEPGARDELAAVPGSPQGDVWVLDSPPSAHAIELCRTEALPAADCGLVLALANDDVRLGTYSQDELERTVHDAGYEWRPGS